MKSGLANIRLLLVIFIVSMVHTTLWAQSTAGIKGIVKDRLTGELLVGATISIKEGNSIITTDNSGYYQFKGIRPGKASLTISHVGYETLVLTVDILEGAFINVDAELNPVSTMGSELVVTASKRPEKIVNAAASIHVIGKKELAQFSGSNSFELLSKIPGVETVRIGVDGLNLNARGLNNAFNNKVFHLIDGRNSLSAISTSLMLGNNSSVNKDDIERMEILLGPQTALYGPNVHNMLVTVTTKDPRKYQGTSISLSAGNQEQFSGRFRHAHKLNKYWAYKLTGEYAAGRDFEFYDSVRAGGGPGGVFGPPVAIPERIDQHFSRIRGEGHLYYSVTPKSDLILSAGGSNYDTKIIQTQGHAQVNGMENIFLQLRFISPRFYANVYNTWANSGFAISVPFYTRDLWNRTQSRSTNPADPNHRLPLDSAEMYATRITNRLVENNKRLNAELQYNYELKKFGLFLVAGLSYQRETPRAYGNTLVDSFERINVKQYGLALQVEKQLLWKMRLFAASRLDRHSGYGNYFSPKIGLVKSTSKGSLRITWGQAYSMPSISYQYASNGGVFFGNRDGVTYLRNGEKVGDSITMITAQLKPEQVSTWEIGYKGTVLKKLFVDLTLFKSLSKNFFSPSISVPGRALYVGTRRVTHNPAFAGEVVNGTLINARFNTIFNFGEVKLHGLDLRVIYTLSKNFNISLNYSWIGSDIEEGNIVNDANKDGYVAADERSINSPTNRVIAIFNFQDLCKKKLFGNIAARYISQYDFYSGNQISTKAGEGKWGVVYGGTDPNGQPRYYSKNFDWGALGGFTSFELGVGYHFNQRFTGLVNISNLFNTKQREFAGSPLIGRLIMAEVKLDL